MSTLQVLKTYYSDVMRVDFNAIPSADAGLLANVAAQVDAGVLSLAAAGAQVERLGVSTTTVANLAYQFFTGVTPYASGLDYLVSPTGGNPNNLNAAYYQGFNLENRFINFAVNIAKLGEGQARFTAAYGGLSLSDALIKAYTEIFGAAPSAAQASSLLNDQVPNGLGGTYARSQYFAFYGQDGANGVGTKAAMIGWLLAQAAKEDIGPYAKAEDAFLADLGPDGVAQFHTNLALAYGGAPAAGQAGVTINVAPGQSVSPTASDPTLRSTANADTVTIGAGLDAGQTVTTGDGDDKVTINGTVYGAIQIGNGNATVTLNGSLGYLPANAGAPPQAGTISLGGGMDTLYLSGSLAVATSIVATGTNNVVHVAAGGSAGEVRGFQTIILDAPGGANFQGAQVIYDMIPSTFGVQTIGISAQNHEQVVLKNTSYGVNISDPTVAGQTDIEVHLDNFTGAPTTKVVDGPGSLGDSGPYSANGGSITVASTLNPLFSSAPYTGTVTLHVDSNSSAGMIYGYYTSHTIRNNIRSAIPTLKIEGAGSLSAQIYSTFKTIDATAAGDLNLSYQVGAPSQVPGQGSASDSGSFLFSNGTDTLSVGLGHAFSFSLPTRFVFGAGIDALVVVSGDYGFSNLAIVNATVVPTAMIEGFKKGIDHLTLDAMTHVLTANVQQYADGASSLTQALTNVSAHTAVNTGAVFTYAGDTYVYQQDTLPVPNMPDGTTIGDSLIKLVGVAGLTVGTGPAAVDIHYG